MTDQDHRDHDLRLARQIIEEHDRKHGMSNFFDQFVMLPLVATIIVIILIAVLA